MLVAYAKRFKHTAASFFANSDRSVHLRVTQEPRSPKLVISMLTITLPLMHTHGVIMELPYIHYYPSLLYVIACMYM